METRKMILVMLVVSMVSFGQSQSRRLAEYNLSNKIAIQGYDPVAYFKQNKAIKGKKEYASSYQGVVYYFSSEANKDAFSKNPSSYEPQYGGWCAFAMGDYNEKVAVNPETFKIVNGKLYLFYNKLLNNTLKNWNKNEDMLRRQADENWKKIIK
jgi:YHS domain-containing protein